MSSLTTLLPAELPLTAAEIRLQCRIDDLSEDALLEEYVSAAARQVEEVTGRPVGETQYLLRLQRFPAGQSPILLPRPGVVTIESVTYRDPHGVTQELTDLQRQDDLLSEPAALYPAIGASWPATQAGAIQAVSITYRSGSSPVDPLMLQALRLAVGDWYEHRENSVEKTVSRLPLGFDRLLKGLRFRSRELQQFLDMH